MELEIKQRLDKYKVDLIVGSTVITQTFDHEHQAARCVREIDHAFKSYVSEEAARQRGVIEQNAHDYETKVFNKGVLTGCLIGLISTLIAVGVFYNFIIN